MYNIKYSIKEISAPLSEPLLLSEVKAHLRIDTTFDDSLLQALIVAAREMCERSAGVALISRQYAMLIDNCERDEIHLPKRPLVSVDEVNLYADDDSHTLYDAENYLVDTAGARLVFKDGAPYATRIANSIEIKFTAGFGSSATSTPQTLRQGMLQLIAYMYENRGDAGAALKLSGANEIFRAYRKASVK